VRRTLVQKCPNLFYHLTAGLIARSSIVLSFLSNPQKNMYGAKSKLPNKQTAKITEYSG